MKRNLTGELRASLNNHADEAPAPDDTVSAVLARAAGGRRSGRIRVAASWAAAAAVVVAAAAVLNTHRDRATTSTAESAGRAASTAGSAAGPLSVPGGVTASGALPGSAAADSVPAAGAAGADGFAANGAASPVTPRCEAPGTVSAVSSAPLAVAASGGRRLVVLTTSCVAADGTQQDSQVGVYDAERGGAPIGTLVTQGQALHVQRVFAQGHSIVVRAAVWRSAPGPDLGAVYDYPFVVAADGGTFSPQPVTRYAGSCPAAALRVSLTPLVGAQHPSPVPSGSASVLRLTNVSGTSCAVEGYADFIVTRRGGAPAALTHGASGPAGGLMTDVAPVIVLRSGDTASAIVESAPSAASDRLACVPVTDLFVELSSVGPVWHPSGAVLSAALPTSCRLVVHPLVAGASGTG